MMMELFLLRHANADTLAATDDERPLSEKGVAQAMRVARFCEARGLAGTRVISSPVLRALQTAEIVAGHFGVEILTVPWLACGMRPEVALDHLRECADEESVMLVGHEPDFSRLAAHLIGLSSGEQIEIRKASLTRLAVSSLEKGGARLDFLVPCKLM
jgi:phosphohistidine phosphatase